MNRHLAFAALLILFALVACSRTAAAPDKPYSRDDRGIRQEHGGGDGGGGSGM